MPCSTSLPKSVLLTALALVLLSGLAHPQQQDLIFERLSVEQGMPTNVTCILQDRTGYLWFGTYYGLYRHDGYGFVPHRHDVNDTSSIRDNAVTALYEDRSGVLWVGSKLGLDRYDGTKGTFLHYAPNPSRSGEDRSNTVLAICEARDGTFWIGTASGLHQFDRATGTFTSLPCDSTDLGSISHRVVNAIYEDTRGALWFATGGGLDRYDAETRKFSRYWNNRTSRYEDPENDSEYWVLSLCEDETGTLWLGTNGGLVKYNPGDGITSHYRYEPKEGHNHIHSICQDAATGALWMATGRLLLTFDRQSKTFDRYEYRANAVCSERSGTLWLGTDTYIEKLNRAKRPFKKYPMNDIAYGVKNGKEGILWIYTPQGYRKFDIQKEEFVPYSFGGDSVVFVYNDGGEMVLYSKNQTLSIMDSLDRRQEWVPLPLEFANAVSISWKGSKAYWVGTYLGGLFAVDAATRRVREMANVNVSIEYIYEDRDGVVWTATSMGKLFSSNQSQDAMVEFVTDPKSPSTISGRKVNEIYESRKGMLWFATNDGLYRLERSTRNFIRCPGDGRLPSNTIRGILEDDHGCLWMSTNKGISKYDPETDRFQHYDASYGVEPTADVLFGRGCKTTNGEMFFAGAGGFTRFHPDSVRDNLFVPPVVITTFRKFDKPCPLSHDIQLPYDENFIAFEFAALSYVSPERNQYAHMLEGLDKDWVYSGTRRYASYPGLEPGTYKFRVKASNNDGVWNEAGTSLSIVISPPWWKTPWAYLVAALLVLGLLYVAWKMQVKSIRMGHAYAMSKFESEKLHEVDELKSRFFTNISHEFRTPLTLILGPVKQIIETTEDGRIRDDLQVVHRNANRLLALVNQLLDVAKLESGTMKLRTVPQNIVPFLKSLVMSFASYAERKRITLTCSSTPEDINAYIDAEKLEKIITNLLSNAFKFTPEGGTIDVAVTRDEGRVNIAVRDTGTGIPAEKMSRIFDRFYQVDGSHTRPHEGTGIGLSLTRELVELHKGSIEVESVEGKGTTFVARIPLGKDHLKPEEICEPEKDEERNKCAGGKVSPVLEEITRDEMTKTERPESGTIAGTGKPVVLIVEDNADVRRYVAMNVRNDYDILEAIDGEDGWNKSTEHLPDVIVSDVMMPGMDGFALCEKLKGDERTSHIPVILLTAKASSRDKIEGLETGADDYIMKPFEPEELKARIANLIEQRKRLHEHFRKHGLFEIEDAKITPVDQKFLQNAVEVIARHISDAAFGVETLAAEMAVSRSVLLKKIEALVGEPPSELIKRTRLERAAKLIEGRFGNISEVSLEVGFSNPSYFAECFKKQYGSSPSQYRHRSPEQ